MEKRSHYLLQFASLSAGLHNFEFHITDVFFEPFKKSLINKADVMVKVTLEKGVSYLQFTFDFKGLVHVTCVRCLDEFDIELKEVRYLLVRQIAEVTGEEMEEEDIINFPFTATEINLVPHIYDYLNLMVPLNPVHPDKKDGSSGCNQESLKEMNKHLADENEDQSDPRWEILKKLKLKLK